MIPPGFDIPLDHAWAGAGWRDRTGGASVVSVSGGILTTESVGTSDPAFRDYYVPILPGQRVDIEVWARMVSGEVGIFLDQIDHDGDISLVDSVYLDAADWKLYRVGYTAPQKSTTKSHLRVGFGVRTADVGEGEWFHPVIRTTGGYGSPLVIARGLVRLVDGSVDLHTNFPHHGVSSVAFNGTTTVTVNLDHEIMASPQNVRPLVFVTPSFDQDTLWVPMVGQIATGATPSFQIKWTDGTSTQTVSTGDYFAWFMVTF